MANGPADLVVPALFSVRVCRMENGERLPLVVDQRGLPVQMANRWIIFKRRRVAQSNTLIDDLRTIAHTYDWAQRRGIDLEERIWSGNGLKPRETVALFQHLRYRREFGRTTAGRDLVDASVVRVVIGKTHATRVARARDFLTWGLENTVYELDVADLRVSEIRERCDQIRRQASEFTGDSSDTGKKRLGLTRELLLRLLAIVHPAYPGNPFRRTTRFRNWLIVVLLFVFGLRRSELLVLWLGDVNTKGSNPSLKVMRRPDDPEDTRGIVPAVKTLGREFPMGRTISDLLDTYTIHHRSRCPNADDIKYLLVSTWGNPLAVRSVNSVLEQLITHFPEFDGILSPHVLRHTFNDAIGETARSCGIDSETLKQSRNYLNGWQSRSDQGDEYTRRTREENAQKMFLAHQASLFA